MGKSNSHSVDLIIECDWWNNISRAKSDVCVDILGYVCEYLTKKGIYPKVDFAGIGKPLSFTLVLSNSDEVRRLNYEFRGMDKPTNVLSFANVDGDDFEDMIADSDYIELGDIIMSAEVLQSEADIKKISPDDHFAHLLVHGILHLLGFDHQTDEDADVMESIEIAILAEMNIDNPYKE